MHADSHGLAYNLLRRSAELDPTNAGAFHNIGKCYHECLNDEKADEYFRKAVKVKPTFAAALEGMGLSALHRGDFDGCIDFNNRALAEEPGAKDARVNRAMAYLAKKRWIEGWRDFDANLGDDKNRKEMIYGDEIRWTGDKGQNVICYGEQGLGDEISFASCIPDLIRDSKHVTIECDMRLKRLFKRSFPQATVYGTRYKKKTPAWKEPPPVFDARVAMGTLPGFYRLKDSAFHGKPYLVPNPQMATAWRALLASLGDKPKIGIAWTGGIPKTGQKRRSVTLDTFGPLFKSFDAEWVSLQYKESEEGIEEAEAKYGIKIHDWEWGNRQYDYDQTAALVSELDVVISVTTAVVDLAGGLGKECWCLVPKVPLWRHGESGDWFPWAKAVTLFRQKGNEWPIHLLLGKLKDRYGARPRHRHQEGARTAQEAPELHNIVQLGGMGEVRQSLR